MVPLKYAEGGSHRCQGDNHGDSTDRPNLAHVCMLQPVSVDRTSLPSSLGPADRIRRHLAGVESLRAASSGAGIADAVLTIKRLQALRFRHTYRDFLDSPEYALAARFFLDELYGVRDFTSRDQQFSRIAGGIETLFPEAVAELAVKLTELHSLTEQLDHHMALVWQDTGDSSSLGARYLAAWLRTGTRNDRERQLMVVSEIGSELQVLARKRGIRTGLRLMRGPARAAGLDALQSFLETGFDAFSSMRDPSVLMNAIHDRETGWLEQLYDSPGDATAARLTSIWI